MLENGNNSFYMPVAPAYGGGMGNGFGADGWWILLLLLPGLASDSSWQRNLKPEQCRLGKHTGHEQGQTQCGQDAASTPYICQ